MKKTLTIICIIGSTLIILDSLNISHLLIMLLLAGVVPGTNILISPIDMMAASATAVTIVLLRVAVWPRVAETFFIAPPKITKKRTRSVHYSV